MMTLLSFNGIWSLTYLLSNLQFILHSIAANVMLQILSPLDDASPRNCRVVY